MSEDDFLSRWSRRKRAVAEEQPDVAATPEPEPPAEPQTEEEEGALLAKLNLPVPESLQPGDDFSAFMADHVPQFLRKRALRVLWRSNPVLANLDGLNDYDEDFRSPELTQKVLATAYQVGRGFVTKTPPATEPEDVPGVAVSEEDAPGQTDEIPDIVTENRTDTIQTVTEEENEPAPRPRRMRFES